MNQGAEHDPWADDLNLRLFVVGVALVVLLPFVLILIAILLGAL